MNNIIDIETIPLPIELRQHTKPIFETMKFGVTKDPKKKEAQYEAAVKKWAIGEKAALNALEGQVVIFGLAAGEGDYTHIVGEEIEILQKAMEVLSTRDHNIAGHNIYFDLRFLVRRSFLNGVSVPSWLIGELDSYRSNIIIDTMKLWGLGDRSEYISLTKLCAAFGIPVKDIEVEGELITGAEFYKFWEKDKGACIEYNKQDVLGVREILRRVT